MSKDWVKDIAQMHAHFKFHEEFAKMDEDTLYEYLDFRVRFLQEELDEIKEALENRDAEEIIDGLIDLAVVDIGTLDLIANDPYLAWDAVHSANMSKRAGVKENRPNPHGLPDLMKPDGWVAPSHSGNHGRLEK
jgi:hypothetical protein